MRVRGRSKTIEMHGGATKGECITRMIPGAMGVSRHYQERIQAIGLLSLRVASHRKLNEASAKMGLLIGCRFELTQPLPPNA